MSEATLEAAPDGVREARLARRRRRARRFRLALLGLLLLVTLLVALIWIQRREIAGGYIEREFERRGVQATYKVAQIGLRTQRLEDVVIGNPANPDLTADWVEVEVVLGVRRPRVGKIIARGVRLRGRIAEGKVSLGEIDKLLPPPTGEPFRLPNQRIDVADATMWLDTPAGGVALAFAGSGNLAYSFEGRVAAAARGLELGEDCRLVAPRLSAAVRTEDERPSLDGPVSAESVNCGGVELKRPRLALRTTLAPGLDGALGTAGVEAERVASGRHSFSGLAGRIGFDGNSERVAGTVDLTAAGADVGDYAASRAGLTGRYAVAPRDGDVALVADVAASGVRGGETAEQVARALGSAAGTPIEPIADLLATAIRRAGQGFNARGSLRYVNGPGYGAARLERLTVRSRSNARLALGGGTGVTYYWPAGASRVDGAFELSGGGFPDVRFTLSQSRPRGPIGGIGRIAPMRAGAARLALGEIRFNAAPGGTTSIETTALVDGPFNDGRVEGLLVPIRARLTGDGGFTIGERCTDVSFRMLQAAGLRIGPTRLPLCPTGRALLWRRPGSGIMGGADVRGPRLAGRVGSTPIAATADRVRFSLSEPGFTSTGVAVRLGGEGSVNRFDFASLSGRFTPRGVVGSFAGGDTKLANVPLLIGDMRGEWSVLGGDLRIGGALSVADEADPARFYPLRSDDFRLTLDESRIDAGGWLVDPETGTRVTQATIVHQLNTGTGNAVLDVPGITFNPEYQPEQLTRLTEGVVALVDGTLTGRGEIAWNPEGTSSNGTFSTRDMNLAATFGPVEGLTTTIEFTDLLGLVTAPGQRAEIGVVRTGINVFDGLVRYRLLPNLEVLVEGGRWPFAGGELLLEETLLDFSRPSPKRLTFRVNGLDAATFIQQMEFTNISATGTFDGVIPMIFDESGGRIVDGRLAARDPGGTLSYIGELTDRQLGYYGKLAFDALKSLRYDKLDIQLNGALDGEFLAAIELDGIARETPNPGGIAGAVIKQLARIPLEFNINIRGPFRALIATARSFDDPSLLIQPVLPEQLQDLPTTTTTVQPEESETVQ